MANLYISLAPGIDSWEHVYGLLGGAIFAWFTGPRWEVVGIHPVFIYRINVNIVRSFWVQVKRSLFLERWLPGDYFQGKWLLEEEFLNRLNKKRRIFAPRFSIRKFEIKFSWPTLGLKHLADHLLVN